MIGYKQTIETKVISRQHEVGFIRNTSIVQLRKYLSHVPDDANFVDYKDGTSELTLVFENTKEVQ